jgi:hypothetical protein
MLSRDLVVMPQRIAGQRRTGKPLQIAVENVPDTILGTVPNRQPCSPSGGSPFCHLKGYFRHLFADLNGHGLSHRVGSCFAAAG